MIHESATIHPTAFVNDATIGARTVVRQLASISGGCVIGEDCSVSPFAMLHGSRYGDRVRISGGVKAGPGFRIGDDVFLGPNVVLGNDAFPMSDKEGFDAERFDGTRWAVIIENGAGIGANATILPGVRIGRNAMVAAGSVVGRNVPDNHLWIGVGSDYQLRAYTRRPVRMRFAIEPVIDEEAA